MQYLAKVYCLPGLALLLVAVLGAEPARAQTAAELERPTALDPTVLSPNLKPVELQPPTRSQAPSRPEPTHPPGTAPSSSRPAQASEQPQPADVTGGPGSTNRGGPTAAPPTGPIDSTAVPLQRSGSLMNQGSVPSAPAVSGKQREALKPLRQVLLSAPDMAQAEAQRRKLASVGVRIVYRKRLTGLGAVLSVFQVPEGLDQQQFADQLRGEFPDTTVETNQRYRLMGQPSQADVKHYGQRMLGLTIPSSCTASIQLAMLDSGVNALIPPLNGRSIRFTDVTGAKKLPRNHGTAIATLLISSDPAFPGLLPKASLEAIGVFAVDSNGEPETRTDWVLLGLDHLAQLQPAPQAVNMSFGGNYSAYIKSAIDFLAPRMLFVAAAGNAGTEDKVYPAAYDNVIAVGAVDARQRRSRSSNFGAHVRLYAPGEDIWVSGADSRGFFASGSSYATPFATAALAVLRQRGMDLNHYIAGLGSARLVDYRPLCDDN